jgi:hypothetical protein
VEVRCEGQQKHVQLVAIKTSSLLRNEALTYSKKAHNISGVETDLSTEGFYVILK